MEVGELFVTLKLDSSEFDKGLNQAQNTAEKGGSFFSNALSFATGGAVLGGLQAVGGSILDVAKSMVTGNAQFETYQTQFGVLLGGAQQAKDRLAELAQFGASTPFDLPQVVEADKILQSFGLRADDVKDKFGFSGKEIETIAGDTASGTGASFQEMSLLLGKFSQGATGEAISRMAELGIASRADLQKMGLEFDKSGALLSPLPESMNVVLSLMKNKFGGMMDAQSATFDGMLSNAQDWVAGTIRTMGAPIFEVVKDKLGALLTFVNDPATIAALNSFATTFANGIGSAMNFIANTAIPALTNAWNTLQPILQPVIDLLVSNLSPILLSVATLLGGTIVVAVAGMIASFATVAAPIVAMIAIGATLFSAWQNNFLGIQDIVTTVINAAVSVIQTGLALIQSFWQQNGAAIMSDVDGTYTFIKQLISAAVQVINATIVPALTGIASFIREHGDTILAILDDAWTAIKAIIDITIAAIKGIISIALDIMRGDWKQAWTDFLTMSTDIWGSIKTLVNASIDYVKNILSLGWDAVKSVASAAWNALYNNIISPAIDNIKSTVSTGVDNVKSTASTAWNNIKTDASTTWGSITSGLSDKWTTIKSDALAGANQVKSDVTTAFGDAKTSVLGILDNIISGLGPKWTSIKSDATTAINGLKNDVLDTFSSLNTKLGSALDGAASSLKSAFSGIGGAIKDSLNSAVKWINKAIDGYNDLAEATGLSKLDKIPGFVNGTNFFQGGLALVGERGPELVSMPRGSQVSTNRQTQDLLGGAGMTFAPVTYITIGANAGVTKSQVQSLIKEGNDELAKKIDIAKRR